MPTPISEASIGLIRQGAQHTLFVEGIEAGLDVTVLSELLTPKLRVVALGPSYSIRSVATALHAHHPEYWFLIDRDDWDDDTVERSWQTFPDPSKDNLLIWRRKELESYFLEPEWVTTSAYLKPKTTRTELERWLASEASKNLYLNADNRVLVSTRNCVKGASASLLSADDVHGLSREQIAEKLVASPLVANLLGAVEVRTSAAALRAAFEAEIATLSGDTIPLVWGVGRWRELLPAKALFRAMVNRWFVVPDMSQGRRARLTGRDAERAVAIELLRHHQDSMPTDLAELRTILSNAL